MIEPFQRRLSHAALALKALVRKFDLQTYVYKGFWATPDTAVMNTVRFIA